MNISGTYTSLQPVVRGDLVQLVLGRKGFVMKVYEKSELDYEISNIQNLVIAELFQDYLVTISLNGVGIMLVNLYTDGLLKASQTISSLTIANISLVVGSNGIYILFDSVGITHLPGVSVSQNPVSILAYFGFDLQLMFYITITGATSQSIVYDNIAQTIYLVGISSNPLFINGNRIINKSTLYSFVILLSSSLIPATPLVADNLIFDKVAVGNGNIAFTERFGSSTTLNYITTGNTDFSVSLGVFETSEIQIYDDFIAVLGRDLLVNAWYVYQFLPDGTQITKTTVALPQTIQEATLAYNSSKFLVYALIRLAGGTYRLSEFDIYDDIVIWSTPVPSTSTGLIGIIPYVGLSFTTNNGSNTIRIYNKRLPFLIGAVSEVIYPNGTGTIGPTGCITGFHSCTTCPTTCTGCTGNPICCANTLLPGCVIPYIVTVDFISTKAFSPVVPGQEYFINLRTNTITIDEALGKYIGTALDDETVIMLSTGCLC